MTSDGDRRLGGEVVAITGRLASMSRDDAVERVRAAGGTYVAMPTEDTTLLVVGQGGPPLGDDGRITASLRRARALQDAGHAVAIVPEEELLARLELADARADLQRLYTTGQLARILGVPVSSVRAWVRHELIEPVRSVGRLCFFDFPQVSAARSLLALTRSGVTPARIRRSLEALRRWLPEAAPSPAALEALERPGTLLVRLDDGRLAEPSGQLRLEFDAREADAHRAVFETSTPDASTDPADWFDRGIRAEEEGRMEDALRCYERARALGGPPAEIEFNIGNTLYALGRRDEARHHFRNATEQDPQFVEAWNNLGNLLSELERADEAVAAYRHALALAPHYPDAHYNLAETLAALGDTAAARHHWTTYLELDPHSRWAEDVRRRLSGGSES